MINEQECLEYVKGLESQIRELNTVKGALEVLEKHGAKVQILLDKNMKTYKVHVEV